MTPFRISHEQQQEMIILTVEGEITWQTGLMIGQEATRAAAETGLRRVLVDLRQARNVSAVMDHYSSSWSYQKMERRILSTAGTLRIAFLTAPDDTSHDASLTGMIGLIPSKNVYLLSKDESSAREWLMAPVP
ncbi:hypothetical protein AU468_04040 [Alkalispirochaeta sphaeroplastigenens]|uniref:STAS/SEC14 domain-containing protein n=1 Tax=Alkalispirochaeta sphaeroplastigenens TaxID=1187066 RepID=A0A2S4JXA6_9SPIO|nr:hypothetical protein [Alkalispirochaeta sphaeroplastigenens]POR04152.1 hypothetical protein AU468_04040 [Alkalispirochaeta sphaeroplastigenens]